MKPAQVRLFLTALAFLGWLGYLGYLVVTRPVTAAGQPLVVSRAQVLGSELDVVATITDPREPVTIDEVLWPQTGAALKAGERVAVAFLDQSQGRAVSDITIDPPKDFTGPGKYLVPLKYDAKQKRYRVAEVPASPGFGDPGPMRGEDQADPRAQPASRWPVYRIYPATADALGQYWQHRGE